MSRHHNADVRYFAGGIEADGWGWECSCGSASYGCAVEKDAYAARNAHLASVGETPRPPEHPGVAADLARLAEAIEDAQALGWIVAKLRHRLGGTADPLAGRVTYTELVGGAGRAYGVTLTVTVERAAEEPF
jgi:hypothetical protein